MRFLDANLFLPSSIAAGGPNDVASWLYSNHHHGYQFRTVLKRAVSVLKDTVGDKLLLTCADHPLTQLLQSPNCIIMSKSITRWAKFQTVSVATSYQLSAEASSSICSEALLLLVVTRHATRPCVWNLSLKSFFFSRENEFNIHVLSDVYLFFSSIYV